MSRRRRMTDVDYRSLAQFRRALRSFLHFSEEAARAAGITPAQYQLMVMIRGAPPDEVPTIGDVADDLHLRHNSAVELVDRAEAGGLVRRVRDSSDGRRQRLELTSAGLDKLDALARVHVEELRRLRHDGLSHLQGLP